MFPSSSALVWSGRPGLSVDRFRPHDQIATGPAIHDVAPEPLPSHLEVARQPLADRLVTHRRRQSQVPLGQIIRPSLETHVYHRIYPLSTHQKAHLGVTSRRWAVLA